MHIKKHASCLPLKMIYVRAYIPRNMYCMSSPLGKATHSELHAGLGLGYCIQYAIFNPSTINGKATHVKLKYIHCILQVWFVTTDSKCGLC